MPNASGTRTARTPRARRAAARILLVDGDRRLRQPLAIQLERLGCVVKQAGTAADALEAVREEWFHLAICELDLEGEASGLELLPCLLSEQPELAVVITTADVTCETVVDAIRRGAMDYLRKPLAPDQLRRLVEEVRTRVRLGGAASPVPTGGRDRASALQAASASMRSVLRQVQRAAPGESAVLFRGEVGAGKSVLARALHAQSPRRLRPLVSVDCRSGSQDLLARALFGGPQGVERRAGLDASEGGTLFLDEVDRLSPDLQSRLERGLRAKQRAHADVRVVSSTARDLRAEARGGRFGQELLARLSAEEIHVPPLRERIEDILPLADSFAATLARRIGIRAPRIPLATRKLLVSWSWPGNVRELRQAIEHALLAAPCGVLAPEAFPPSVSVNPLHAAALGGPFTADQIQREHALRVLAWARTHEEAARILGVSAGTLRRKRREWAREPRRALE